ncbi:MAG: flagellar protein FlbD [Clostridiales bacterium]|jgi:flagellar protein FlbD|nr:flagellar protein FlbD [Clostridiales bacterium]MDN5281367.1 flagellar protein FlbD [Candidatus Ozemobacter sp.]
MIRLSRLNGQKFILNADLIEQIETTPDTVITLINGKTIMVAEPVKTVMRRILRYRRKIHRLRTLSSKKIAKGRNNE